MKQLFVLLACFCVGTLSAQTIGVYGAYGQSGIRSGDAFDAVTERLDQIGAATIGITTLIPLTPTLAFRPALEYTSRGTAIGLTESVEIGGIRLPVGGRAKTRFDYVDVPLLLQYEPAVQGGIQPYLFAGPSLGYAVSGRVTTSARALIDLDLYSSPIDLDAIRYDRFHVAATGGAGARAQLSPGMQVFGEARYQHGLTQPYDVPFLQDKVGFRGWNFGAGVLFTLN